MMFLLIYIIFNLIFQILQFKKKNPFSFKYYSLSLHFASKHNKYPFVIQCMATDKLSSNWVGGVNKKREVSKCETKHIHKLKT